ncbi:MAG: hypothetical protein DRG78_01275 [Epsilonproteobacteria bacterium]|nr:MAG: hypothetical protein DRG78_01275 [Campylobacterota bacterium]
MKEQIEFFKSYSETQHLRREKIYEQFFYFSSLLALQIGFFGYYLLNFPIYKEEDKIIFYIFIICLLGVFGLIIKIFFIGFNWINNKDYAEFGKPSEIKEYITQLEEYSQNNKNNNEWDKYILNEYINISDYNITINEKRHHLNMSFRKYLGLSIIVLFISFVPYFFIMGENLNSQKIIILNEQNNTQNKEISIRIINDYLEIKALDILNKNNSTIEDKNKDNKMANDKKTETPTKQQVTPAPTPPPTRYIQDSVDPVKASSSK